MAKKAWTQVGSINVSKKGKLYISFKGQKDKEGNVNTTNLDTLADAIANAGEDGISLQIEKPQDKILRLASLGFIDEDEVEAKLERLPDWIKYEITLPPND